MAVVSIGGVFILKLNLTQLVVSIQNAPPFSFPEMNKGTAYLFNKVYTRLSRGEDVGLSSLDFNAFDQEDIDVLKDLYYNVFEQNSYQASNIVNTIRQIAPVCKTATYI